jgi:glutaredoxin-like protein NrdH
MIRVYTKPDCVQCKWTKKFLDKMEVAYEEHDVTTDEEAANEVRRRGFDTLPVVVTAVDVWAGFKIDKLKGLQH